MRTQAHPCADVMDSLYLVKQGLVCVDVAHETASAIRQASLDEDDSTNPSVSVLEVARIPLNVAAEMFADLPATAATSATAAGASPDASPNRQHKTPLPRSAGGSSLDGLMSKEGATARSSSSKHAQSFKGSFKTISSYPFGENFGASALTGHHDDEWPSTFVAKGSATVLRLRREAVIELLGADLTEVRA